jgi:Domain of unknown function (DUF3402)
MVRTSQKSYFFPLTPGPVVVKSTPIDLQIFRQETFVKYPTFTPAPVQEIPSMKLAEALAPIPVRHHYNHQDDNDEAANSILAANGYIPNRQSMGQNPQAATPAPTPPASPKPKKQQYQTDQTKPFIFPFSSRSRVSRTLVPFAIDEADQLYAKHMHVSLALFQMWRTREDFILDESGLKEMPRDDNIDVALRRYSVINSSIAAVEDDDAVETLPDLKRLEEAIAQSEKIVKAAEASGNRAEIKKAQERKEDLQRLRRVEIIYVRRLAWVGGRNHEQRFSHRVPHFRYYRRGLSSCSNFCSPSSVLITPTPWVEVCPYLLSLNLTSNQVD